MSDAEMLARLRRVSESGLLLPDQAALFRWAVRRIAELEGALREMDTKLKWFNVGKPLRLITELGEIVRAVLAPEPAKKGEKL